MKISKGYFLKNMDLIKESYHVTNDRVEGNISDEKILLILKDFIKTKLKGDLFFFCEYDDKTFYLDYIDRSKALEIVDNYGEVLKNDGYVSFGFGDETYNEIGFYQYNLVNIFSKNNFNDLKDYLSKFKIEKVDKFVSGMSLVSSKNPGEIRSIKTNDLYGFEAIDKLIDEEGMYQAK
jgi:hypothetical protein